VVVVDLVVTGLEVVVLVVVVELVVIGGGM
jgi:hypothetical protein